MATLKALGKSRVAIKNRLVRVQADINSWDPATVSPQVVDLTVSQLPSYKTKLEDLYEQAVTSVTDEEMATIEPDYESLFVGLKNMQVKALTVQSAVAARIAAAIIPSPSLPAIKLERVKLPTFSGNFCEWQAYHDLFVASVHNHPSLSGVEKMVHLKSSLTGEAKSIVSAFQPTEANYLEAWESMKKRFNNPREIIFAHLQKFDQAKVMSVENSLALRSLADTVNECVRSLKVLNVPVDSWDLILIFYSMKKLDTESKKQWSLVRKPTLPTLSEFLEFLESRALALGDSTLVRIKLPSTQDKRKTISSHHSSGENSSRLSPCPKCSGQHFLTKCQAFFSLPVSERREFARSERLCFVCLGKGHSKRECKKKWTCHKCNQSHNNLLHSDSKENPLSSSSHAAETVESIPSSHSEKSVSCSYTPHTSSQHVLLLGTLVVTTDDSLGIKQDCRVFVDPGSEPNFISENCVSRLGLKRKSTCVVISGVGDGPTQTAKGSISLRIHSKVKDYSTVITCLVLPKVTAPMPRSPCRKSWPHLEGIELGDPNFHQPGPIDILLGCVPAARMKLAGLIHGPDGEPIAQETKFGWLLTGHAGEAPSNHFKASSHHISCSSGEECLEDTLQKFWTLEEPDTQIGPTSEDDRRCEDHFASTYKRDNDGRYTVRLPFKDGVSPLGHSRQQAIKRFNRVEARLSQNPVLQEEYSKAMKESITLGFMERIPENEVHTPLGESYYMPHREVVKESSTTTKVRIVFDASAKTSAGNSLNDVLMTGPKLQVDLVPLLIRFRSHLIAMSADITKFYPQFKVDPRDVNYQRLVWRDSPQQPLLDYRMTRVTFGVTCAPFLAIRCLNQLAEDEKELFPLASATIKADFLVDNMLTGSRDVDSARLLQDQVGQVMKKGNLELRKWSSNSPSMLKTIPREDRDSSPSLTIDRDGIIQTIGLLWQPNWDTFGVSIVVPDLSGGSSKRKVLSSIARIFDPLGWLGPVTIRPKVLMQELWKAKLDWDSPLPLHLHIQWISYCEELPLLKTFRIDRCILRPNSSPPAIRYELHGFSDASQVAMAACIYCRTVDKEEKSKVNLVTAKTKVAPVKRVTVPRLELCGAVLLAKLMKTVREALNMEFSVTRCWTDSTIVLDWLASKKKLNVFESNRVSAIEAIMPRHHWHHVEGVDNPADPASRGISAKKLVNNQLWLHGPAWLCSTNFPSDLQVMTMREESTGPIDQLIETCSSFLKMKRIMAYCLRFIKNSRTQEQDRTLGELSVADIHNALIKIVVRVQSKAFSDEIKRLRRQELIKSPVKFLTPFMDSHGVLRVGGRLDHSCLPYEKKHPILLPKNHNLTTAVVRYFHLAYLHAGPQLLLSIIRSQFWITRGPDVVKRIVQQCVVCHRHNPSTSVQLMGQLPPARVRPSRPFSQCGVDYAGPFTLCSRGGRNPLLLKYYVAVYICMATTAVHLETVSDLSTQGFIASLQRFLSRRGLPADIHCDGGTNFVGAKRDIDEFQQFIKTKEHQEKVTCFLSEKGINFHFSPPFGPHHGGLWEAAVKSMKSHLKKVIGVRHFSVEEFSTLLCQVEACLNSRPLSQMSSDPSDFRVLTPGHFLIGDSLVALPRYDLTDINTGRLTRWQAVQQTLQHFWKRWSIEYLHELQTRSKWLTPAPNIQVGTLVLVKDESSIWGPCKWKMGRISAVFPGKDGLTRVVDVTIPSGATYRRPIVKISQLPIYK